MRIAWLAALLLLRGAFIYGLVSGKVTGLGFGAALVLYILGWLVGDPQVKKGLARLWEQRQVVVAFTIAQIALILFMRSLAQVNQFSWLLAIFLLLAFAYLLRFFRQVPPIFWVIDLALVLYTFNINRWFFSVIGDDFAFFNQALSLDPTPQDLPSIYSYMGLSLKDTGEYRHALDVLHKGAQLDPERTDIYNLMGFCHFKLKEHEKAIENFNKVIH